MVRPLIHDTYYNWLDAYRVSKGFKNVNEALADLLNSSAEAKKVKPNFKPIKE